MTNSAPPAPFRLLLNATGSRLDYTSVGERRLRVTRDPKRVTLDNDPSWPRERRAKNPDTDLPGQGYLRTPNDSGDLVVST